MIETETVVMRSVTGTVRLIKAEHRHSKNSIWIEARGLTTGHRKVVMAGISAAMTENDGWHPI